MNEGHFFPLEPTSVKRKTTVGRPTFADQRASEGGPTVAERRAAAVAEPTPPKRLRLRRPGAP